jgi:ABC-type transporter Mla subunit MlaD
MKKLIQKIKRSANQSRFIKSIEAIRDVYVKQIDGLKELESSNGKEAVDVAINAYLAKPSESTGAALMAASSASATLSDTIRIARDRAKVEADQKLVDLHELALKVHSELEQAIIERGNQAAEKARALSAEDGVNVDVSAVIEKYELEAKALPDPYRAGTEAHNFVNMLAHTLGVCAFGTSVA